MSGSSNSYILAGNERYRGCYCAHLVVELSRHLHPLISAREDKVDRKHAHLPARTHHLSKSENSCHSRRCRCGYHAPARPHIRPSHSVGNVVCLQRDALCPGQRWRAKQAMGEKFCVLVCTTERERYRGGSRVRGLALSSPWVDCGTR